MKKLVSLILVLALALTAVSAFAEAFTTDFDVPATGEKFIIYSWNDEFQGMLKNYYIPAVGGTVNEDNSMTLPNGDVIEFVINPNDNGNYQAKLDAAQNAGEQIDMFLMEADYALKYVDSDYSMDLANIGITEDELTNQYQYTIDVAKDANGALKGSSWQAAPGLMMYRRSLAEKYLGVTSEAEMQELVKDWDSFLDTARKVNEVSGGATKMVASTGDIWQVIRTVRSQPWVDDTLTLAIDDQVIWFFNFSKTLTEENLTANADAWSEAWNAGMGNDTVFSYFMSTWGIQWTMLGNSNGSKPGEGTYGDWAAINGPQAYYWGGTWLAVGNNCKNTALAADIIRYFTIETDSMQDYCLKSKDYVNNKTAIQNIIDAGFGFDFLGGQDHYSLFQVAADLVDTSTMSAYDQNINNCMTEQVTAYANGQKDLDSAIADFKASVVDMYPEISAD